MSDDALQKMIEQSADVVQQFQQASGAYPACPNFDVYKFCWFRDGSFTADAMSRAGRVESAEKFFAWASRLINERREHILGDGRLNARYTYDGQDPLEPWNGFQLDGYGTWLWALKAHEQRHGRSIDEFREAAGLVQHYLATHWQEDCADWWEEWTGRHAATLACVYAGLKAFDHPEAENVRQAIDLGPERTDGSLLICSLLDVVNSDDFAPTLQKIEAELVSAGGGVYRYAADTYYGGGEWLVLTAMLGWQYARQGRTQEARAKLDWVAAHADASGWLPEQSHVYLYDPGQVQPWIEHWGQPATPLLWSHAMFLTLATELQQK
jgi:GH15 family glucan-1,4-alpha-glucosidase